MEKEEGHTAYLLLSGRMEVVLGSFQNNPQHVALLSPGVIFGEMSLLEDKPRSASVVVVSRDASVLELTKTNFLTVIECDAELAYNLLETMLKRMNGLLDKLVYKNNTFVRNIRIDPRYVQISGLSIEQFQTIVSKDSAHALTLLKFLSHLLTQIDEMAIS